MSPTADSPADARVLYSDMLERCLLNNIYKDGCTDSRERGPSQVYELFIWQFGRNWPGAVHAVNGRARLPNLRELVEISPTTVKELFEGCGCERVIYHSNPTPFSDHALVNRFIRKALVLDPDGPTRPEFSRILKEPSFPALRHEFRTGFIRKFDQER